MRRPSAGESNFAEAPERALISRKDNPEDAPVNPRKGDRLVKSINIIAAKQTFKTPTTLKIGDHEVVRTRVTRVSTTLALAKTEFSDEVPEFNPLKLLADSRNAAEAPDPGPEQDVAEVAFVTRDLAKEELNPNIAQLSIEEVRAQVAEHIKNALAAGAKPPVPLPPQLLLMRTSRAALDPIDGPLAYATPGVSSINSPFSSIEVRMVPENVTLAPKSAPPLQSSGKAAVSLERLVIAKRGEDIADVLRANGVDEADIASVSAALGSRGGSPVAEGRKIKLSFIEADSPDQKPQLARVSVYADKSLMATAALANWGGIC